MHPIMFKGIDLSDIPEAEIKQTLPQTLLDLAEVCPLASIFALVEGFGGIRAYIPQSFAEHSNLADTIGPEHAEAIIQGFYEITGNIGDYFYIPLCTKTFHSLRNKKIRRMRGNGETVNALARKFAMSDKRIEKIIKAD